MSVNPLIPGTFNSRDLGGVAVDGGVIRRGMVIRSDAPVSLGPAGHAALRALEIRSALDLREPVERNLDPPDFGGVGLDLHHRQILGDGFQLARDMSLADIYRHLIDARAEALTAAVRLLAAPGILPAIVFCSAGKDRTGLVAALTLAAVGAGDEAIIDDYALTEANMHGAYRDAIVRRARAAGIGEQAMAVKVGSPPALMRETLRYVRERHGDPRAFLAAHGMAEPEFAALREALVLGSSAQAAA